MDIKFQKEPKIKKIKIEKLKSAYEVPRDEKFKELYTRYLQNDGVVLDEILVDIEQIETFSEEVDVPDKFIEIQRAAIRNGEKPELYVYKKGKKYIMSDDYPSFLAYHLLGWTKVPVSLLKVVRKK